MSPAALVLMVVVAGAVACLTARRRAGAGLAVYPQAVVCALAAQVALLTEGETRAESLGVAGVLAAWMLGSRLGRRPRAADATTPTDPTRSEVGRPDGRGGWSVDFAYCGRCESVSVASGPLASDPAEVVTRSACSGCGAQFVGVASPTAPGQLVWFEQADVTEEIA